MKSRSLLAFVVLLATACGETSSTAPVEGGTVLRYGFTPGDVTVYEANLDMDMVMAQAGGGAVAADVNMTMTATERITYSYSEGPSPNTVEILIDTEVLDGGVSMEMMGSTQDFSITDMSGDLELPMRFVVDAQGTVLEASVGGQAVPVDLFSDSLLGGGSAVGAQPLGPEFPEYPVAVGSVWTTDTSQSTLGIEVSQHGRHEIIAEEEIDGRTAMRVVSCITTGQIALGWDELMDIAVESAALSGQDPAELDATVQMMQQHGVEMSMVMRESTLHLTTWFDPETGTVLRLYYDMPMEMQIAMSNVPDVGSMNMIITMDMTQYMELAD